MQPLLQFGVFGRIINVHILLVDLDISFFLSASLRKLNQAVKFSKQNIKKSFTFGIFFFVRESVELLISHFFLVIYYLVATVGIKVYFTIFAL